MFKLYLPHPIYERLPLLYCLMAGILIAVPGTPWKWVAVAALVTAALVTRRRRHRYREAARIDQSSHLLAKYGAAESGATWVDIRT